MNRERVSEDRKEHTDWSQDNPKEPPAERPEVDYWGKTVIEPEEEQQDEPENWHPDSAI